MFGLTQVVQYLNFSSKPPQLHKNIQRIIPAIGLRLFPVKNTGFFMSFIFLMYASWKSSAFRWVEWECVWSYKMHEALDLSLRTMYLFYEFFLVSWCEQCPCSYTQPRDWRSVLKKSAKEDQWLEQRASRRVQKIGSAPASRLWPLNEKPIINTN